MKNNNSNFGIKTIIFLLIIALSCLIFFGLMDNAKTTKEIIAFSFVSFAELVAYLCITIPGMMKLKKLENSDFAACGVLFLIGSLIINLIFFNIINDIKPLVIYNVIEIIIFGILICLISLRKK